MKNYLVILVTIGIGAAYWYQMPEPPPVKEPVAVATPPPPVAVKKFVPSHTALDEPASRTGQRQVGGSVLLGNDQPSHLHP